MRHRVALDLPLYHYLPPAASATTISFLTALHGYTYYYLCYLGGNL
jgi:hypothetical protein